jgi:hypothetical protein
MAEIGLAAGGRAVIGSNSACGYDDEARALHRRLWQLREVDGVPWSQISERLDIDEPRLAKIRKAAVELGLAIKGPNGRVRWLAPGDTERAGLTFGQVPLCANS